MISLSVEQLFFKTFHQYPGNITDILLIGNRVINNRPSFNSQRVLLKRTAAALALFFYIKAIATFCMYVEEHYKDAGTIFLVIF